MKQLLPFLAKVFVFLILCVIPLMGVYLLSMRAGPVQATSSGSATTVPEVDIPISKTQMAIEGQPLKKDQLIQLSVYVPKDDGKGLTAKVVTYAKLVNENERFVILSVPSDQAANLEEALLTENAKLIYHEIAKVPDFPAPPPTLETTPIPTPETNAVQLKIPVQEVQGGIVSIAPNTMVRLVIVEQLAIYHVNSEPVATYEPSAPVDACATVKGFMVEDLNGLIDKEVGSPKYVLLEISVSNAPKIARALTNASSIYLLHVKSCTLKS